MHRRRSGVVVSRPFITVRTGTRRQRPVRKFLYGSSKTKRIAVNGQQCHVPIALQEAPSIRDESPMDIETGIQKEHQPSMHYKRKEKEVHDWQSVRDILVPSLIDSWSPCLNSCCSACDLPLKDKIFRCLDCSPNVNFCVSCVSVTHQKYILHIPEVWKCGTFLPYLPEIKTINTGHSPNCGISIHRIISVFDDKGRWHQLNIQFCSCEEEVVTMIKLKLWPATAKQVKVAFAIELMKWMEILLLECKVSTKGFCEALIIRNDLQPFQANHLKELIRKETVCEFRHSYYKLGNFNKLDDGTVCPACPKGSGTRFVAIDANFGLLRRKKAGDSMEPPKHGSRFFITDEEVSNFVNSYNDSTTGFKECNQFKAGDKVRSKSRTSKMDVTGVFGSVCRHESPVLFMNMQHGERLAYSVLLLDKMLNVPASKDQKLNVTYDIACVLFSHLKIRNQDDMLAKMQMKIPIFHCYGHQASCQVEFNPRRTTGFGLTDGEGIERLWSYLRCFARITKEMTPSHRVDLLTDALLHYAKRKERNIGKVLVQKHSKAVSILKNTEKEIGDKIRLINKVITEETIQEWKIEEKATLCSKAKPVKATWEEIYVEQLQRLNSLRECIQEDKDPDLIEQYTRLQKSVACLEKAKGISKRWHKDELKYISANDVLQRRCQKNILDKMREGAQERMFLLDLKKKYYDGQAVAKRLCGQVNRSSNNLKKLLAKYKAFGGNDNTTFADVSNPDGNIYLPACETSGVPLIQKREIIKLSFLKERAQEEIFFVEREMKNVMTYYLSQQEMHCQRIAQENVDLGEQSYLVDQVLKLERIIKGLANRFCNTIDVPTPPDTIANMIQDNVIAHVITDDSKDKMVSDDENENDQDEEDYDYVDTDEDSDTD